VSAAAPPIAAPARVTVAPRRRHAHPLVRVAVVLVALAWSLPTAGLLISSVRPSTDVATTGWWTLFAHPFEVGQFTARNYDEVLGAEGMALAFMNSLIVTIPSTVVPITLAAFAAYAFAWLRFPGRTLLFGIVIALLVVPLQMTLIPLLRMYVGLDLNGTFVGTWLAHTAFGLPLAIYLLYNYMATLPRELFECAFIDGATSMDVFRQIVLPLSVPAIASFAIFQFLWVWNDLLVALVFLGTGEDVATLTAGLNELVGSRGEDWQVLTAGAFISMVVPLLVFLALQRYFVRGLLAGSVKA
jgi:alpha-glucoside transport system permease protein